MHNLVIKTTAGRSRRAKYLDEPAHYREGRQLRKVYRKRRLLAMTELDRKALGRRIREARTALGLTQPRLAERLGVSLTTIERHEAGARCPSLALVFELARLIGKSLDDLCGTAPVKSETLKLDDRAQKGAKNAHASTLFRESSRPVFVAGSHDR